MHRYQPIPDLESGDTPPPPPAAAATRTNSLTVNDIESQLSPKYEPHNSQQQSQEDKRYPPSSSSPPPPTTSPTSILSVPQCQAASRKPWVILSVPIAIAVLISTSVFVCMSSSASPVYIASVIPSTLGQHQQQQDQPCAIRENGLSFDASSGGILSSSLWPRIPLSPVAVVSVQDSIVSEDSGNTDAIFRLPIEEEEVGQEVEVVVTQAGEAVGMNEDGGEERVSESEMGLDGIEIIAMVDPVVTSVVEMVVAVEVDSEQALEGLREDEEEEEEDDKDYDDYDKEWREKDDEEDEEEEDDDNDDDDDEVFEGEVDNIFSTATTMLEQVAVLESLIGQEIPVPNTVDDNDLNLDLSDDGFGTGNGDSVVFLSLSRSEAEGEDEDEQDHFPTNIRSGDDDGEDGQQQKENPNTKGGKGTTTPSNTNNIDKSHYNKDNNNDNNKNNYNDTNSGGKDTTNKHKRKYQDQNANLGGTGGNGPILLCSSKSCLPSLRDSILSKLSVQVQQVMDHLRNRHTLVHMMSSTAPQTKESLMAGQEELVQQLEDRIMKDLRDWVNGVGRKSSKSSKKAGGAGTGFGTRTGDGIDAVKYDPQAAENTSSVVDKEVMVEMEGLFLDEDEFEEGEDDGADEDGFHMASLSFEDADDDDEDHEDDSPAPKSITNSAATPTPKNKKNAKPNKNKTGVKLHKRDITSLSSSSTGPLTSTAPREYFLSADKLLMRQEWSRWIAHWVHHTKLLIISHTLATPSLVEMNRIAVSGENVVPLDQRHWSWNLDKALATVMVASEMICGGPASAKNVKVFLATLSMSSSDTSTDSSAVAAMGGGSGNGDGGSSSEGMMSPKALAITLNAQKCIESWSDELEEILQRTATNA
ncbi:hypothetical protein BGZ96_010504 [Linnemannia gamsii]|uniref:Uncharacterized protein n=1 Tax=Linnemannia gamsii TaxID=64522 RepID=A0ABQ7JU96_9FUNG|nr:hypothetical protein BGZ96_010504 [Linnemannia gamsii]